MKNMYRGLSLALDSENFPDFIGHFKRRQSPRIRLSAKAEVYFVEKDSGFRIRVVSLSHGGLGLIGSELLPTVPGEILSGIIEVEGERQSVDLEVLYSKAGEIGCAYKTMDMEQGRKIVERFPSELAAEKLRLHGSERRPDGTEVHRLVGSNGYEIIFTEDHEGPKKATVFFLNIYFSFDRSRESIFSCVDEEIPGGRIEMRANQVLEALIYNVPEMTSQQRKFLYTQLQNPLIEVA